MPIAVGVIQALGFPPVLAAADAMVKAARVTLVQYGIAESGHHYVVIRGNTSEVDPAIKAGIRAVESTPGNNGVLLHYIVPNPPENLEAVLPIDFTEESNPFRGL